MMMKNIEQASLQLEIEMKLFINEQLYKKGTITETVYQRAKNMILKDISKKESIA